MQLWCYTKTWIQRSVMREGKSKRMGMILNYITNIDKGHSLACMQHVGVLYE